ncbi:MAG: diaminopimelate decarboxylase [Saprospiraceae bacterium]
MQLIDNKKFMLSGNIDPLELCNEYGTPVYVYDSSIIHRQYNRLLSAFDVKKLKINYAAKANTNLNILKLFKKWGAGLDCVSIQEVQLGIKAGFKPSNIVFTPNGVGMDEYDEAVKLGVRINIDSISILEQFGQEHADYPICIRINPHIMAGGNAKISVGHIDSKFGISIYQMPHVERVLKATGLRLEGVHMHSGSDILDIGVFLIGADILFDVARKFPDIKYIDFGSGFKVPYKADDYSTDIEDLGKKLSARFKEFCKEYGRELTLEFEPGKFLVSEAGFFFTKVNVVKQTTSSQFASVDTGLNHLIRPMFYDSYHHIVNVTNPDEKPRFYNVVGYICETDTFAVNRVITEIIEGDILCFFNAGAYCYSMASNYNSRFRPAEVLIHEGKAHLIRKRETLEDLTRNTVNIKGL